MAFGLTFRGVSSAIFSRLRSKARQNGIAVAHSAGQAVKDGVKIQWKYDPDTQSLEVGCVRAPFWIDTVQVNRKLCEEIETILGTRRAA